MQHIMSFKKKLAVLKKITNSYLMIVCVINVLIYQVKNKNVGFFLFKSSSNTMHIHVY